jgi:ribulose-phosphate 3-epimerase
MPAIQVAPSILSADFTRLAEEIASLEASGADVVHVDVMDGHFVPNLTFGPPIIAHLRKLTRLPFDVHLMIENAERWVAEYRRAGADWISVHVEAVPHLHRTLQAIRESGAEPGIAINPGTALSSIEDALPWCHHVLLMSVNPGFGGQKFIPEATEKARRLAGMIRDRGLSVKIEMDGGLTAGTVREPVLAGVSIVVAGSAVMGQSDRAGAVRRLREACA